jgi:hypothetical protein
MTEQNIVAKYYQMDPETEDMLPNGGAIKNGMVVLIADPNNRFAVKETDLDWEMDRILERNRWATVSHVISDGTTVVFIAEYEDGTKKQRMMGFKSAWLVKKASMPSDEKTAVLRSKVFMFVKSALMVKQEMDVNEEDKCSPLSVSRIADQTAGDIMDLLQGEK